jgi:predicted DNA-binding transcriptional regulator YafY
MNKDQTNIFNLVAAIAGQSTVSVLYTDKDGITSGRDVRPQAIERCDNHMVIARVYDVKRKAQRSLRLDRIVSVLPPGVKGEIIA